MGCGASVVAIHPPLSLSTPVSSSSTPGSPCLPIHKQQQQEQEEEAVATRVERETCKRLSSPVSSCTPGSAFTHWSPIHKQQQQQQQEEAAVEAAATTAERDTFKRTINHSFTAGSVRVVLITTMAQVKEIADSKNLPDDGKNAFKTLFCKENVFVHPSGSRDDGIPGYLSLIELDDGSTAFAWTPYYMLRGDESAFVNVQSTESKRNSTSLLDSTYATVPLPTCTTDLYAVRVPLCEIQSFRKMASSMGTPNIIVVLQGGIALPPYYFHAGGVREFLSCVEEYASLIKSLEDPNLFFVHDLSNPLAQSLAMVKKEQKAQLTTSAIQNTTTSTEAATHLAVPAVPPTPSSPNGKESVSWNILENFAKITRYARLAEKSLFTEARSPPPPPSSIPRGTRSEHTQATSATNSPNLHHSTSLGSFEVVGPKLEDRSTGSGELRRGEVLSQEDWISYFDEEGRIPLDKEAELRKRIFYGGIEPELRQEVWKYMLGYFSFNSTFAEREKLQAEKRIAYNKIKSQWTSIDAEQESHFAKFRNRRHRIEKDVVRTDRTHPFYAQEGGPGLQMLQNILVTYAFFNFDLGYVQGMSDLLSPILVNMQDEAAAYWCFKNLMDRIGGNFHKDQNGMHTQLVQLAQLLRCMDPELYTYLNDKCCTNMFFCFRWVLIQFKREFPFDTVMTLWEMLWTNLCGPKYHLFLCISILMKKRSDIISNQMEFDDILKFLNNLSMHMKLQEYLVYAELLYMEFCKKTDPQFAELYEALKAKDL